MLVTRTPTPTAPAAPPRPHPPRTGRLGSRICSRPSPRQRQSSPLQRQQPPPHLDLLHMSVCARVSCSRVGHGRRSSFVKWGLRLASGARSRSSGEWGVGQPCRWGRERQKVKSSLYINNRQPNGSLSNVLRKSGVVGEGSRWRPRWRWRRGSIMRRHTSNTRHSETEC